jgi:hypothetical protein
VEQTKTPPTEARRAAERALSLIRVSERSLLAAAESGLKARHMLCQICVAGRTAEGRLDNISLNETTDLVDEALILIAHWESSDEYHFITQAVAFFTLGCFLYRTHQPQFLAEFILETLQPAAEKAFLRFHPALHRSATDALWQALRDIQRQDFNSDDATRLARLAELREAEKRLAEWYRRHASPHTT